MFAFLRSELNKKLWNSPLQMAMIGAVLYVFSVTAGGGFGCGPGNSDFFNNGAFACYSGEMPFVVKALIFAGLALGSLSLGRAVSLLENTGLRDR